MRKIQQKSPRKDTRFISSYIYFFLLQNYSSDLKVNIIVEVVGLGLGTYCKEKCLDQSRGDEIGIATTFVCGYLLLLINILQRLYYIPSVHVCGTSEIIPVLTTFSSTSSRLVGYRVGKVHGILMIGRLVGYRGWEGWRRV